MNVSELIRKLQEIEFNYGDLPVVMDVDPMRAKYALQEILHVTYDAEGVVVLEDE